MYTVLIFPGGRRADAVLLSASGDCLRLAIVGRADAAELRKIGDRWISESGTPVELGALVALGAAVETRPRTLTAGRQ
jgi:hypothetical protein